MTALLLAVIMIIMINKKKKKTGNERTLPHNYPIPKSVSPPVTRAREPQGLFGAN